MSREKIEEMARDIFAPKVAIDGIDFAFAAVHGADKPDSHFMRIAQHLYNAGYRKSEWISVEERLPEEGGMYLVYNPSRAVSKVVTARYSKSTNRWCGADACCYHEGITHWMPLPEPPKKGGE